MAIHKYLHKKPEGDGGIYKKEMLPIMEAEGIPIYISRDGKVHAKGFVDTNDNFEFHSENDEFKVTSIDERPNYFKEYLFTKTDNKLFRSESYEVLVDSFQNIYYPLNLYSNQDPPDEHKRYNLLSKTTKSAITATVQTVSESIAFQFHHLEGSGRHSEPRVLSSWFGPFNFDVRLDPELMIQNINDLIVVKSGKYNNIPKSPTVHDVELVSYTTGVLGNVYIDSPSIPSHDFVANPDLNYDIKRFKFKNKGNQDKEVATSTPTPIGSGAIGIFKNGVLGNSPVNTETYNSSGEWTVNSVHSNVLDSCYGEIEPDATVETYQSYVYKAAPTCLVNVYDNADHSPLLGFARDGFPIYGPHAYTEPFNPTSPIKTIETSYRLKHSGSRTRGPSYADKPSGAYIEDYEYVSSLGDLDDHNGRTCITPEFPNGTYAYFTTINSGSLEPSYPYIVGPKYHGKVASDDGFDGQASEAPLYYRIFFKDRSEMSSYYPDNEVNLWEVYGDTNRRALGIQSEKVVFVSPHVVMQDTGAFLHTGKEQKYKYVSGVQQPATFSGNLRMATGNGEFLVRRESYTYPTSVSCKLLEKNPLSGGMNFLYEDPDTNVSLETQSPTTVTGTHFYAQYKNHKRVKDKFFSGQWNGVIPAGTPFKVESWAFNGEAIGYDGKLCVRPIEPHPLTSGKMITLHSRITGEGADYDLAYSNTMELSRKDLNRKLNILLVNSGVKNKNHRMKAWENLKDGSR